MPPPRRNLRSKTLVARPRVDWLSRALARAGVLPVAQAEEAISAGRVKLNGRINRQPMAALQPADDVRLDGQRISLVPVTRVLAFHKPYGVVTAPEDREKVGTVFERLFQQLPEALRGYTWHAVGRLDRDTTGLLLFTNDEALVTHVTSPDTHLPKRYEATVQGELTEEKLQPLRRGMALDDGATRPAHARILGPHQVELTLEEGRFHQAKRMLGAVGLPVRALRRTAIGSLQLDVPEGTYRELNPEEIRQTLRFPTRTERPGPASPPTSRPSR